MDTRVKDEMYDVGSCTARCLVEDTHIWLILEYDATWDAWDRFKSGEGVAGGKRGSLGIGSTGEW